MNGRIPYVAMTDWQGKTPRRIFIGIRRSREKAMLRGETIFMVKVGYKRLFTNCRS
jgi:hypothetical protein